MYFVIFIDDYSRFTWIYFMKNHSQLYQIYFTFFALVKAQFLCTIKTLRTDNVMEYKDSKLLTLFAQHGTIVHHSYLNTSQPNGCVEHKHRHILDTIRTLLSFASCLERLWGEASLTIVYTINWILSAITGNQSPYERLYG